MKMLKSSALSALVIAGIYSNANAIEPLSQPLASEAFAQQNQQLMMRPGVKSVSNLKIHTQMLSANTNALALSLKPGIQLNVKKFAAHSNPQGNLVWKGKIVGDQGLHLSTSTDLIDNSVIMVKTPKGISATIRVDGQLYKVVPGVDGSHAVMEIDEASMPMDHPPGAIEELNHQSSLNPNQFTNMLANMDVVSASAPTTQATPDVKVLVAYTASAASASGDINGLIQLAVAETNTGYANSGIDATMTLVHSYQVNYTEVGHQTDRDRFAGTNDGYMDEVHGLRDQYGADVAVIVNNRTEYCGIAKAIGADSSTAFATVHYDCATGYYSFGHEVGHLLGARHDPNNDPTTTPYSYGHGYQHPGGDWRTVMAYNCPGNCTRINWWSNPNKTRNGAVMGTTSQSDNARVLNQTTDIMAGFKGEGTPPTGNELTNGQAKTNLSGGKGSTQRFYIDVPSGASNLNFAMSGGSGDADLYVKFGSEPTKSSYDCRPYVGGNNESCPVSNAQTGRYHVMIDGYSAYSGVSLTASYSESGGNTGGTFSRSSLSGSKGTWKHYTIQVPSGMSSLTVAMSGGSGDADVYVRKGARPTLSSYNCRPWKTGNNENCSFSNPGADTWHISIYGYASYSGVNLNAEWKP